MRMIFVNLPVKNLQASKGFFTALGFSFNPDFSDDKTACMIIDENIYAMLLVEERRAFRAGSGQNAAQGSRL